MARRPTRRDVLGAGAATGAGLLAGCTSSLSGGSDGSSDGTDESPTDTDASYTVTMSPVGEVEFDGMPEAAVSFDDQWLDHMVALGVGDRLTGLARPDEYFTDYYDQLPGVGVDTDDIEAIWGGESVDKELLYELDADVHHIDPHRGLSGIKEDDVEELSENVAPFFANRYSRSHNPPEKVEEYDFYTLWELAEKFGEVYQRPDRAGKLKAVRDEIVADIEANLPPEDERPVVGLVVYWNKDGKWYPYQINQAGFGRSQYQHLGVKDAFNGDERTYNASYDAAYDHEGMLDIDPDILIQNFGITYPDEGLESMEQFVYEPVRNSDVASELTAVQNDRFYPGGSAFQGPIYNLFQIEIAAKQIYPEQFGEWKGVGETPEAERLFDRQKVADIVNGGD